MSYRPIAPGSSAVEPQIVLRPQRPIPAFRKGEPYIPADFGFPIPRPHVIVTPPPPIPHRCYLAGAVMQQLLYLRQANGAWFCQDAGPAIITVARFLLTRRNGRAPAMAHMFRISRAIYSPRYFASLLRNIPLQAAADRIYPPMQEHAEADELWVWQKRTKNPKITDKEIWPIPKFWNLYHAWWEKYLHRCLNWRNKQWPAN